MSSRLNTKNISSFLVYQPVATSCRICEVCDQEVGMKGSVEIRFTIDVGVKGGFR